MKTLTHIITWLLIIAIFVFLGYYLIATFFFTDTDVKSSIKNTLSPDTEIIYGNPLNVPEDTDCEKC
jgi:phosphotransferase system  glucose/maltose/N-acetylglucosamine-specific IIC component